ncbi:MAG: hypothetical protein IT535_06680 [Bauldia sp.]|nr:hypothetical protein [Bauldia sp.]
MARKFLVLYMAPRSAIEQMTNATAEEAKAGMDAWTDWGNEHANALVDMGAPLGKTKKVDGGGVGDTRNDITGYGIVEGESLDEVAGIFTRHPHLMMGGGAWIEIIETVDLPGM